MGDTSYGFFNTNLKMNSTSGTQSSENESLRGDMSYLYGRDPSILAYSQRPFPSQDSKKNLMNLLEEEDESVVDADEKTSSLSSSAAIDQTIKVFLRMKPFPHKMKITKEQSEAYSILNPTTLQTKMPSLEHNTSCLKKIKTNDMVCREFIFTQTFGPDTTQLQLFDQAVKPQMVDFLAGKNSVVMSYGTTNSGKTYTLQGTPESPGLIPRGIEFVFSNITPRAMPSYKPVNQCDVIHLNHHDRVQETELKLKLLTFNPADKIMYVNTYKQMQRLLHAESPIRPSHNYNAQYSVWVSFAEIYNETIYDLLWTDCQKKRPALKLASDGKGRAFIKGLKNVCVNTGAEAYQVLMAGQYNLKVAATALNSRSSRSHCIFTIKLLKYRTENDPYSVEVSTFAFCDLAGSERLKKTLNVGERLKEAQNINTSLLVLGRCLKTIYESQCSANKKIESIGPFRESKLTRLFQRALSGKEQISMIVNVNPVPNLYVETQNVLNFSAIAKKIVIEPIETIKRRRSHSRFSRLCTQSMKTDLDWENTELEDMTEASEDCLEEESDMLENDQEAYEDLLTENELLKKEIKELKASALTRDMQTRQEMTDMYSEIMKKLEADWKNRLIDLEEQQEDLRELAVERIELFYKEKLSQLNVRKRSRPSMDGDEEDDDQKLLQDLEVENTRLIAKMETMKKSIRALKQMKEEVETTKTKISFELAVAKEEAKRANEMFLAAQKSINSGDDVSATYIEELNEIIKKKDDRIKTMKTFLNEAKEEYISITDQAQKLEEQLKERDELLVENSEQIRDLEEQLSQANAYSAEQNKVIENLEEELDQLNKKLIETEEKARIASEQMQSVDATEINKKDEPETEVVNDELDKTKALLEEMKLRLELSENDNIQLKEKLNQRVTEIQLLKNNLDTTKNQLDKLTEKVDSLTIDDKSEEETPNEQRNIETAEQETQTEKIDSPVKYIKKETAPVMANISLQTIEFEDPKVETEELSLQTSLEIISMEVFDELKKQYEELQKTLEGCKFDKSEAQKQFEEIIKDLQTQINVLAAQEMEKSEKISTLQKELDQIVKDSEKDKAELQALVTAQDDKDRIFMDEMAKSLAQEQEKDNEISSLQKEMKKLITSNDEMAKKMEVEMKVVLKDLTSTKTKLADTEEKLRKVEKDYMQVIHILEMKISTLDNKVLEKQGENEKLKLRVEEYKKSLIDREHEMDVFTRNRNTTVEKYEKLVKSQNEELDRMRREITRLQDLLQEVKENAVYPTPRKGSTKKSRCNVREEKKKAKNAETDATDMTSEDDHDENLKSSRKGKKEFLSPTTDNIPIIELSGSESKKSVKSASKDPPTSTRRTRKKKLFTNLDESFVDIEAGDPSPCPTRSLRNRRK
ncbi:kinesin-like protein KIF20A [Nasonia vitripennis]|uniref:Kinesin motor domain-containing protein n=1 Tax=Nasonia vitripennis TaxID=7425 RepID=A0A7M7H8N8_NASVI|nr:kinesin-like protein KIF20A [Nasonia vitripennis]